MLAHEFVHAVVAMLGGRTVPAWMNEGLAVTLGEAGSDEADAVLARARTRPALKDLHGSFGGLSGEHARVAYAGADFASAFHQRFGMRYEDFEVMVTRA